MYYFILDSIDFIKRYALHFIIGFILLSGSYIIFREFFYFGTLTLYINEPDTKIIIDGDPTNLPEENFIECKTTKCVITLSPFQHQIFIQKNGFFTEVQSVDIKLQSHHEIFFKLTPNRITITPTAYTPSKGVFFPLQNSILSANIQNFSIQKTQKNTESVVYKNTPLFSAPQESKIYVSSDEIGRNIFIASPEKIIQFNTQNKTTEPSLLPKENKKISAFFPQNTGDYLFTYRNDTNLYLKKINEPSEYILENNTSLAPKIHLSCVNSSQKIIFIAHPPLSKTNNDISVYTAENLSLNTAIEKTVLANLHIYDISHIECINTNTITIFLKDKTAYTVTF